MTEEHVHDYNGDITLGMNCEGFMVERIRCTCGHVVVEKRTS